MKFKTLHYCFFSILLSLMMTISIAASANAVVKVAQVSSSVTITSAIDYTITDASPFTVSGSFNIDNDEAVLILSGVRPSAFSKWIDHVSIHGEKAVEGTNCTVSIYAQGCIVLPYTVASSGLTVYTGTNFTGQSTTYVPSQTLTSLGTFSNAIHSMKLRRGYMACVGTSSSFNRVFIASSGDLSLSSLPGALDGKINFIRVLRWQWPSKKAVAGTDQTFNEMMGTTSFYGWNASDYSRTDREYIPHHHHEGWPSFSEVTGHTDATAILGNNEPDNSAETVSTVSQVLANWPKMMAGGQRIGSPAVAGNLSGWLYPFIDSIDAHGYRCDFVAVHAYWNANPSNFMSSLKAIYDRTHRPLWITEFNYGANWTSESWPTTDRSASASNFERERAWIAELIPLLEAAPYVERYFIYNWVQDCRMMYTTVSNHSNCHCSAAKKASDAAYIAKLKAAGATLYTTVRDTLEYYETPAGKAYADASASSLAFTGAIQPVPAFPFSAPYGLTLTYNATTLLVNLLWRNPNGLQTDSAYVERRLDDGDFVPIDTIRASSGAIQAYSDDSRTLGSGTWFYRIRCFDSDGQQRYSDIVSFAKSQAEGKPGLQYGSMTLYNTDAAVVNFDSLDAAGSLPVIIVSPSTSNNSIVAPVEHLMRRTSNSFWFQYFPWVLATTRTLSRPETSNYMVLRAGNYTFGQMQMEAGIVQSVKNDTIEVTFAHPFSSTTVPIVLASVQYSSTLYPFTPKVWDVTPTGFKLRILREAGLDATYSTFPRQFVHYLAVSPGTASLGNGMVITAGHGFTPVGGSLRRSVYLLRDDSTAFTLSGTPLLFMQAQTDRTGAASILRCTPPTQSEAGQPWLTHVTRQVDATAHVSTATATFDDVAWVTLSTDSLPLAISTATPDHPFRVTLSEGRIRVAGNQPYKVYDLRGQQVPSDRRLVPGLYIVRTADRSVKVIIDR